MRQKIERFQSIKFLIWTLVVLNILLIVMPANAMSVDQIRKIIIEETATTEVPVSLAMAVVKTESNFRADHEGNDGARGLMQILPGTAESLGLDPRSLWDPRPNIQAGLQILDRLLERTEGRWEETIKAYGSHRRDISSAKNQRYVTAVLKSERQFSEQFAANDTIQERRRDVLSGHDDWGTDTQQKTATYDPSDWQDDRNSPLYRDTESDWQAEEDHADQDDWSHSRYENQEIEIIIYETAPEPEIVWVPAPRQRQFQPRQFMPRANRLGKRFARNFRGSRSGRPHRPGRFRRDAGRR